jgi:DNA-binding NtrC family response regulator
VRRYATILVVEDDAAIRSLCLGFLQREGYQTLEAFDGRMGLATFLRHLHEVDLVLTDAVMPHSGVEMAEQILRIGPDVPIIFMSGYPSVSKMLKHLKRCRVLEKPFDLEKLSQMVRESLHA